MESRECREDMLIWPLYNRGVSKVKSGYQLLAKGTRHNIHTSTKVNGFGRIYGGWKFHSYLLSFHGNFWIILFQVYCVSREGILSQIIKVRVLCHLEEGDLDHLFLPCWVLWFFWLNTRYWDLISYCGVARCWVLGVTGYIVFGK